MVRIKKHQSLARLNCKIHKYQWSGLTAQKPTEKDKCSLKVDDFTKVSIQIFCPIQTIQGSNKPRTQATKTQAQVITSIKGLIKKIVKITVVNQTLHDTHLFKL